MQVSASPRSMHFLAAVGPGPSLWLEAFLRSQGLPAAPWHGDFPHMAAYFIKPASGRVLQYHRVTGVTSCPLCHILSALKPGSPSCITDLYNKNKGRTGQNQAPTFFLWNLNFKMREMFVGCPLEIKNRRRSGNRKGPRTHIVNACLGGEVMQGGGMPVFVEFLASGNSWQTCRVGRC